VGLKWLASSLSPEAVRRWSQKLVHGPAGLILQVFFIVAAVGLLLFDALILFYSHLPASWLNGMKGFAIVSYLLRVSNDYYQGGPLALYFIKALAPMFALPFFCIGCATGVWLERLPQAQTEYESIMDKLSRYIFKTQTELGCPLNLSVAAFLTVLTFAFGLGTIVGGVLLLLILWLIELVLLKIADLIQIDVLRRIAATIGVILLGFVLFVHLTK
jgi:hypothetical protein